MSHLCTYIYGGTRCKPRRTDDTKSTRERKNEHETEPRNERHSRAHGPSAPPHSVCRNAAFSAFSGKGTAPSDTRKPPRLSRGCLKLPRPTCDSDEFHLRPAQVPTGKRRGPRQRRLGDAGSSRQRPCTCKRSSAFQEWNPNGRPPNASCAAKFSHKAKRAASSRDANEIRRA